jgi:hypothetical protein
MRASAQKLCPFGLNTKTNRPPKHALSKTSISKRKVDEVRLSGRT